MENKTQKLFYQIRHTIERAGDLEAQYKDKPKGVGYIKRSKVLKSKFESLIKKMETIGLGKIVIYQVDYMDNAGVKGQAKIYLQDIFTVFDAANIFKLRIGRGVQIEISKIDTIDLGKIYPRVNENRK